VDSGTHLRGFANVDRSADPERFVRAVDRLRRVWQALRQRTYGLLDVHLGDHLLDVGCGTGEAVQELAALAGGGGRVVGVDRSETMIREARRRASGSKLPISFQRGDAHALGFADNAFDGCRAERLFIHLDDPLRALSEMCRVTRSGGRVVVAEVDSDSRVLDVPDRVLTRRILHHACDARRNGWIGRQLFGLFRQQRLVDITVAAETAVYSDFAVAADFLQSAARSAEDCGVVTAAEARGWLEQLQAASRAGRYFHAVTAFIVSGRKP
jgi:ubiquinone/menaquinone biosynthesis C-methylase UbiE